MNAIDYLIKEARKARERAIAPLSGFKVGAALETAGGRIYTGCNIENLSLSLSICAERVALLKALSEGERDFRVMAIVGSSGKPASPCGACRQMLWEFAPDISLVLAGPERNETKVFSIPELLPEPFRYDNPSPPPLECKP